MASVLKFLKDSLNELESDIKYRNDLAELSRREKFLAARKIQAWFRGILTRNHFRMLNEKATIIQCHWRGYRDRMIVDRYLIERVHEMWQDYYNRMATKIQAVWRGYWIRKTCLDFQEMKKWLNSVYTKNEETVENMKRFRENEIEHVRSVAERESLLWILFILFKLHHLLRTKHRPGVITKIDKTHSTKIEQMLKCLEYDLYVPKRKSACEDCHLDNPTTLLFRGTRLERCEKEIREFEKSLRAGIVPIFRSQPYEEREKILRKLNHSYRDPLRETKLETRLSSHITRIENETGRHCTTQDLNNCVDNTTSKCSFISTNLNSIEPKEFYDEIRKMDCQLNKLRIKCPIHNVTINSCV